MIHCDICPFSKDKYPGKVDAQGNHFHICGMTGNKVYTEPRREKRYSGTCGLCRTPDQDLWMLYIRDYADWTCAECIQQIQRCQVRRICSAGEEIEPAE